MDKTITRRLTIAALLMGGSVLLSRILGFIRDAVIAYLMGAGSETDAYYAAFTLPDLMNYFLAGGALSITFVPLYGEYLAKGDKEGANHLISVVATTLVTILLAMTVLAELFTPGLVSLLVPGFSGDQLSLTADLTRIVIPGQLFFFVGGILSAVLMVHERFLPVALVPLVYNFCIILGGVLLFDTMGVAGFSVGALVGAILGPLVIPAIATRGLIRVRPQFSVRDPEMRKYIRMSLPLMVGVTLLTADEWIGRYFGSGMEQGTITWLNNARRLMLVPMALIGQAMGQAALPFLTKLVAQKRDEEFARTLTGTLRAALFLSTLAACFVAAMSLPIVEAIYERGRFLPEHTLETAAILVFFAPAIVAWATQTVAVRGFYARKDTLRPMLIGSVVTLLALPFYAILADSMSGRGLALATSIGLTGFAVATLVVLSRQYGGVDFRALANSGARGLALGALAVAPSLAVRYFLPVGWLPPRLQPWVITAVAGGVFVAGILVLARLIGGEEADAIDRLKTKIARKLLRR